MATTTTTRNNAKLSGSKKNADHMTVVSAEPRRYRARRYHVPANETSRARFIRLGTARIGTTLHTLKLVGNLSMPRYEYTPQDVQTMKETILRQVEETFSKFRPLN